MLLQNGAGTINTALRSRERLRLSKEFRAIRLQGSWARGTLLSIGILPNHRSCNRLGLRVQRGVKDAVSRNRTRRLVRAIYQRAKPRLVAGYDLCIIIYKQTRLVSFRELERDFLKLCKNLGILSQ